MSTVIRVHARPTFSLSPYLYMQFMEPLGATDGSLEAAWDHQRQDWRPDVVEAARCLAPTLMRFGGCVSSYYRWREGVGPRQRRRPMRNLLWGGMESNQIGTHEIVDFCRRVGAEPLFCVNFESDGRRPWARPADGRLRAAGPAEAAAWVAYCNQPGHAARIAHGAAAPLGLKLWQIGNETSYDRDGYDCDTAARRTVAFARAMRAADPELTLIAWGDSGWARRMLEIAGAHIDMLAFHHMFNPAWVTPETPLRDTAWRRDPEDTWRHLMDAWRQQDGKIRAMRAELAGLSVPLALTESHFALPGRSRCEVLSTWAAGVANARILNVHERHGDVLKIATLADFCGTTWQVNAVMIPMPHGRAFLMPVARVMALYRAHTGERALRVLAQPPDLDITASRTGDRVFLHVVNTRRTASVAAGLRVTGAAIQSGRVWEIAAPPETEIMAHNAELLAPVEKPLPVEGDWVFPPASVSAVELRLAPAAPRRDPGGTPRGTAAEPDGEDGC
ncbi:MAG TPA: alpha-L-arabinofuranosidase C-terminal domain-containing protein [Armatimonadota bacterium]|nr:alpha-L-arabinofuranosidase C-terminal domain-containing protein [Armatimonadota bacterium]